MRKHFGPKTWIYPMPVLIIATYDENGNPDAMNAAWGGTYDTNKIVISLEASHKTTKNIAQRKAFTVSFADVKNVKACDYVGVVSANDEPDKFRKAGFTAVKSDVVDAPIIKELPMAIECELEQINEDGCVIAKIVGVSVEESFLDEKGNPDTEKISPIIFDSVQSVYRAVGQKVGNAFRDGLEMK